MIQIRLFDPKADHAMVCDWWMAHGWQPVPLAVLPKLGVVATFDGRSVASAWLYMDNSTGVCMMEWLVTDPQAKPMEAIRCISQIVGFLRERALEMDYGVMLTTCRQPALARLYERNGFVKTDEGVTHFLMPLKTEE